MKTETPNSAYLILYNHLRDQPDGPIYDTDSVLRLLSTCWTVFAGSLEERTYSSKIHRAEDLSWEAPILSFTLERHGATVNQSSRAYLHQWSVNFDTKSAFVDTTSFRQLKPRSRPFTTKEAETIAREVVALILKSEADSRYKRDKDGRVTIILSKCLGNRLGGKQTASGRRKKLKEVIRTEMLEHGWKEYPNFNRLMFKKPDHR